MGWQHFHVWLCCGIKLAHRAFVDGYIGVLLEQNGLFAIAVTLSNNLPNKARTAGSGIRSSSLLSAGMDLDLEVLDNGFLILVLHFAAHASMSVR